MDCELNNLPVVDWDLNLKLAGNNKQLASDLLAMMTKSLPDELDAINRYHKNENNSALLKTVHKLHGAIAFCGLPRLKAVLFCLESNLKNKHMDEVSELVVTLNDEVGLALKECRVD